MIYIDDITNLEKLNRVLKDKNLFFKKINNLKFIKKMIYEIIFFYMSIFHKTIKKVIKIESDGIIINLIYIVSKEKNKFNLKRIIKCIKNYHYKNIVLSNSLNNNQYVKNILYSNSLNILDGKYLYELLVYKMVEYVAEVQKEKLEKYEISILINNKTEARLINIKNIIKKCRVVNIITNNIKQFDILQEEMKREYGIIVNVTTNKIKALEKSDIIINYDFIAENFSKCVIPRCCVIFNIGEAIKYYSNDFLGVNITNYMIYKIERYKRIFKALSNFDICIIYESIILDLNMSINESISKIKKDGISIRYFIGNKDKIKGKEILNAHKKITSQTDVLKKRAKALDKIK